MNMSRTSNESRQDSQLAAALNSVARDVVSAEVEDARANEFQRTMTVREYIETTEDEDTQEFRNLEEEKQSTSRVVEQRQFDLSNSQVHSRPNRNALMRNILSQLTTLTNLMLGQSQR